MSNKIRLGYDILSKRAIETESGVNIDDALRRKDQQITDINNSITNIEGDIADIQAVIPDDASSENKLITVDGVDQKIADVLSNSDLIYLDASNGNDENDGLTRNNAVKTISGAIQAFNAANSERRRLTTLKVMILTTTSASHQLPTDEEVASAYPAGYYQPEIYLYSDIDTTLVISNATVGAPVMTSYAIHVMSKYVSLTLVPNQTQFCSSLVYVDAESIYGSYYTTGRQELTASDGVYINSGVLEASEYKPTLIIKSGGSVNLSGPEYWYQILSIEANGAVTLNQRVHPTYGDVSIISHQSSVYIQNGIISANQNVTIRAKEYVTLNNIDCLNLTIESDDQVDVRAAINVYGSTNIKCRSFSPSNASNGYHGNLTVIASESIYLLSSGTFYIAGRAVFEAGTTYAGPPNMYVTQMVVKAGRINGNDGISYSYSIHPYTNDDKFYDEKSESSYIFDIGCAKFYSRYSNIENKYADVTIKSSGKVYISDDYPLNVKSLTLTCGDLSILSPLNVGFFNIDVANMIEMQSPTSNIYMLINAGDSSTSDYVSYDNYSNNTLKCGSLYCSTRYSASDGSCGLIQPSYGNAIKNIDVQVGMVLCPEYYTDSMGVMSPQVLGMCRSGVDTFNSVISGHVGGYVGYNNGPRNFKPSAWNHDVRQIPPSYHRASNSPKPTDADYGLITVKFDDVYETNHFYFDPNQGDDALDGCTRQTAVKTTTALARAIMRKAGYSQDSNNSTFYVYNGVTIHILSVDTGSMYTSNSPTSVSALQDIANSFVNGQGIDFTFMDGYGGWKLQFQFIEFVPEAPNMSLYVKGLTAQVIQARGFYGIHLNCVDTVGSYQGIGLLDAVDTVSIYNNGYYGNFPFYSSRFNCLTVRARNICLAGMFNNLKAVAQNTLYIFDTTGYSYDSSDNCCLCGNTKLESQDVTLGAWISVSGGTSYYSYVGINGYCTIKAYNTLTTHVDSFVHAVCFIDAGQSIGGVFASQYFKGKLFVKCENCSWGMETSGGTYTSFATYQSTSNQGGAGIISIEAYNQISVEYWNSINSTNQMLYGVDLYLKAPYIRGGTLFLYGNNGYGYVVVDCPRQLALSILPYYYNTFILRAGVVSSQVGAYSGGPFSPSGNTAMLLRFNIHDLQVPIRLYTSQMSSYTSYVISGYIDVARCKVLDWGQTIDPDNPPSIYPPSVTFDFALVVGHSTLSGHGFDLTDWVPDNSGTIIVLNDQKTLIAGQGINIADTGDNVVISSDPKSTIVECPVTISSGTATVQLTLNRYNVITGIDRTVTDLVIDFPVESSATMLTEIGFEFYLDGLAQDLNSVTFTNSTEQFSSVVPDEFTPEHIYQGVLVNRCITLVEYDRPDENVMEINGVKYRTVKIGDQTWMAENVADPTTGVWYNNDQSTYEPLGYGKLYTQSEADALASAASGWHLPTKADYETLLTTVGGASQYNKLKSTTGWIGDNNGTNESGFNGYPAGYGWNTGSGFSDVTKYSYFRTATAGDTSGNHKFFQLCPSSDAAFQEMSDTSKLSVRLVKDMSVNIGGRDYKVVQIGNQLWMAENLDWKFNTLNFRDSSNNPLDTTTAIQAAYYNYDESTYGVNGNKYGLLYNWYAVDYLNQHLADLRVPDGWHVATMYDWNTLINTCGENPGTKLKTTTDWNDGNGINYYGFSAIPAGGWYNPFASINSYGDLWTSSQNGNDGVNVHIGAASTIYTGVVAAYWCFPIRLVKNLT